MDMPRLIKFLNLTSSDSDNEALTALRMAMKMLRKDNLTWEKLLQGGGSRVEYRVEYRDRIVYRDRVVEKVVYRDAAPDPHYQDDPQDYSPPPGDPFGPGGQYHEKFNDFFSKKSKPKEPREPKEEPRATKPRADLGATRAAFAQLSTETHRMTASTLKWYNTIRDFYNERGYITIRYLEMLQEFIRKMG